MAWNATARPIIARLPRATAIESAQACCAGLAGNCTAFGVRTGSPTPDRELRRTVEAIEEARAESTVPSDEEAPQAAAPTRLPREKIERSERDDADENDGDGGIVPYQIAEISVERRVYDISDLTRNELSERIAEVTLAESPIHVDEATRRVREAYGFGRAGRRIREAVNAAIRYAASQKRIRKSGDFLWSPDMSTPPVRDRSAHPSMRKIELVCDEEIAEAAKLVVKRGYGMRRDGRSGGDGAGAGVRQTDAGRPRANRRGGRVAHRTGGLGRTGWRGGDGLT